MNVDVLLHGYLPDNGYVATNMEEDGEYNEVFKKRFEDVPSEGIGKTQYHYQGRGPTSRHNIWNKLTTMPES